MARNYVYGRTKLKDAIRVARIRVRARRILRVKRYNNVKVYAIQRIARCRQQRRLLRRTNGKIKTNEHKQKQNRHRATAVVTVNLI